MPRIAERLVQLAMEKDGICAYDEQFAQITVVHFRNATKPLPAARCVLSWREAKEGGELVRA